MLAGSASCACDILGEPPGQKLTSPTRLFADQPIAPSEQSIAQIVARTARLQHDG